MSMPGANAHVETPSHQPGQQFYAPQPNALITQIPVIINTLRGFPALAFETATRTPKYWLVTMASLAVSFALAVAMLLNRGAAEVANVFAAGFSSGSQYTSYEATYGALSFGQFMQFFISLLFLSGAALCLRALALHVTFEAKCRPQSLLTSFNLVATAHTHLTPVYLLTFVLVLLPIPGMISFVTVLFLVLVAVSALVGELMLYVGVNRTAEFASSPLVVHVLFTVAHWAAVVMIARLAVSLNVLALS